MKRGGGGVDDGSEIAERHKQTLHKVNLQERIVYSRDAIGGTVLRIPQAEMPDTSGKAGKEAEEGPLTLPSLHIAQSEALMHNENPFPSAMMTARTGLVDAIPESKIKELADSISATSPYTWWQRILKYPLKRPRKEGVTLVDAVKRILKKVVHSVNTSEAYAPPAVSASSHSKYAAFDLATRQEMKYLFATTKALLLREDQTLVDIPAPAKVFGDIHGQITDLVQFFRQFGAPSHRVGDINMVNYVFNGDFVDRGAYSLEVWVTLCALKVRYHPHVTLIRGNHECEGCNKRYGFYEELCTRFGQKAGHEFYYKHVLPVFRCLPLAAVIEKKVFVAHGGPGWHVRDLEQIRRIPRPVTFPTDTYDTPGKDTPQNVVTDLLWSDPSESTDTTRTCVPNTQRGTASFFGLDKADAFCKRNGLDIVVRSHEVKPRGVDFTSSRRVLTVFSAPRYGGSQNAGTILEISRDLNVHFKAIAPGQSKGCGTVNMKDIDRFF